MSNRIITNNDGKEDVDENTECDICCMKFNNSSRAKIKCNKCEEITCKTCTRTYLLGSIKDAHCMSCQNQWGVGFLVDNLNKSFVNRDFENHRKNVLFDREKARFPDTMYLVENIKKKHKYAKLCSEVYVKEAEYRHIENRIFVINLNGRSIIDAVNEERDALKLIEVELNELKNRRNAMKLELQDEGIVKKRQIRFIHACPAENCKGFLSTAWKCGLCEQWTCSKCFELKGNKKDDPDNPHECKEENLQSAELIKQETKNCPKCAVPIYKVSGCDQMYCTKCHIAFSWRTGEIETGVIHNPHFFEYQRILQKKHTENLAIEMEEYAERDLCGPCADNNMPNWWLYRGIIEQSLKDGLIKRRHYDWAYELYRTVNHIDQTIMRDMRYNCNNLRDNSQLRAMYLIDAITKDEFVNKLIQNEKKFKKQMACLQIYDLLITIIRECVNRIASEKTCIAIIESRKHLEKLLTYVCVELARTSYIYNQYVPFPISNKYNTGIEFRSHKFCKDAYLRLRDCNFVHTICKFPLRRIITLPKNKECECTICNSTLTIPYYKCCFDTYRRVCSKCLFTQKLDDLENYKKQTNINLLENLENEKIYLQEMFCKKKLKITKEHMNDIINYKFYTEKLTSNNIDDNHNDTNNENDLIDLIDIIDQYPDDIDTS